MITECNHDGFTTLCKGCEAKNKVERLTAERDAAIREIGPVHREAERLRAEVERLTKDWYALQQQVDDLEQRSLYAVTSVIDERDALGKHLGDLLAVIHRDGGQWRDEFGDARATEDAIAAVYELRSEVERLTIALRGICNTPPQSLPARAKAAWWERLVRDMVGVARAALEAEALTGREAGE
jgi:phage host-nuclease inhibitor protein Gam